MTIAALPVSDYFARRSLLGGLRKERQGLKKAAGSVRGASPLLLVHLGIANKRAALPFSDLNAR